MQKIEPGIKVEKPSDEGPVVGVTSLTESCYNSHTPLSNRKNIEASAVVFVEAFPNDVNAGTILSSEPRVFEGLTSMNINQGPPCTATLAYSAAAFAEALLYRSAISLNERYGIKLSLAPCRQEQIRTSLPSAVGRIKVSTQTPASQVDSSRYSPFGSRSVRQQPVVIDDSDDDCVVLETRPVKSSREKAASARQVSTSASSPSIVTSRQQQPSMPADPAPHSIGAASSRLISGGQSSSMPVSAAPRSTVSTSSSNSHSPSAPVYPFPNGLIAEAPSLRSINTGTSSAPVDSPSINPKSNGNGLASSPHMSPESTRTNRPSKYASLGASFQHNRSSLPLTRQQQIFLLNSIQKMSKRKDALLFAEPVSDYKESVMGIGNYFNVIKKPMDLKTMEVKLRNAQYSNIDEYIADFDLMVDNTVRFNGPDHPVTRDAYALKEAFKAQVRSACDWFPTDLERARPVRGGRPRKHRKVGDEVKQLVGDRGSSSDSGDSDSDEELYIPRSTAHRRLASARSVGQRARPGSRS